MENKYEQSLKKFLDITHETYQEKGHEIIICGSMSTYLQGCKIKPNDIDILANNQKTVELIAELMVEYEVSESPSQDVNEWLSNKTRNIFEEVTEDAKEQWYMGRWILNGVKIEVAYMVSESALKQSRKNRYIWENGPDMIPYVKTVDFQGYQIKVIPLEIQLMTNLRRGLDDRVTEIIRVFSKEGYNFELLKISLSPDQCARIQRLLKVTN
jgi:predicted nucleotidyltransferase